MTQGTLDRVPPPAAPLEGAAQRWPARLIGFVVWLLRAAVILAVAAVLVLTVLQVFDRHVTKQGFAFDQYARVGLVWLSFLGIAAGFRQRANIRIDLLDHFLPARFVAVQQMVLDLVVVAVAGSLIWVGWQLLEVGAFQVVMDTPLTYQVMYAALLVGLGLLVGFVVLRIVDVLTGRRFDLDDHSEGGHDHL